MTLGYAHLLGREHIAVLVGHGVGVDEALVLDDVSNLGASAGDSFYEEPYLYVGPWEEVRPGDSSYWNAPFGAVLRYGELRAVPDPLACAVEFLARGVELMEL
jgi:hypothetical protein